MKNLSPIEFDHHKIHLATEDDRTYVELEPICEILNFTDPKTISKIKESEVLKAYWRKEHSTFYLETAGLFIWIGTCLHQVDISTQEMISRLASFLFGHLILLPKIKAETDSLRYKELAAASDLLLDHNRAAWQLVNKISSLKAMNTEAYINYQMGES